MKEKILCIALILIASLWHYNILVHLCKTENNIIFPLQNHITISPSKDRPVMKLYGKYTCLMDAASGRVLYENNADSKAPMASTTKIMTCLLAIESGSLNKEVTVSPKAASMPKVHLGMKAGEKYFIKDLLYSLMLVSHNDTAVAIAEGIGGSVSSFADLMNKRAKKIGMTHTNFVTPNGLDADKHFSTAKDMCLLAREALKNQTFRKIITTSSYSVREINSGKTIALSNKDSFLSLYEGALGIKTGFTSKAGYCFVGAANRSGTTIISSTLASGWPPNKSYKWSDTKKLMDYGFQNFSLKQLPLQALSACRIPVKKGKSDFVSLIDVPSPSLLISPYDTIHVKYTLPKQLTAPVQKNKKIGQIEIDINKETVLTLPVYPEKSVQKSSLSHKCLLLLRRYTLLTS